MTATTPRTTRPSFDTLYPSAALDLPVTPALQAPRRAAPPLERRNLGGYRDYYGPNILAEIPVPGARERLAVIDKAWPHSLYDIMLLVARDDVLRTSVGDTPPAVLTALMRASALFADYVSTPTVMSEFGLVGSQTSIAWNHDRTVDRDNGQWWDKRLHLHLNCWPELAFEHHLVRLGDIPDATTRRSLVDPVAYLAHRVILDALADHRLPQGCVLLAPDPLRDRRERLPVGLKIHLPGGWRFATTPECRTLLRTLHQTATATYRDLLLSFTGRVEPATDWRRPTLLPPPEVKRRLAGLPWLTPRSREELLRLRGVLRDLTVRELELLRRLPHVANRFMTLGGLSYNLAFHSSRPASLERPLSATPDLYLVMQFKLISCIGSSPAVHGAVASVIDRTRGPVMTDADRARRSAFQTAYIRRLRHSAVGSGRLPLPRLSPPEEM
ncbi:hypothetical protein [Streptomyces sp. MBT62]|uniref:hypothetical protein n=1 Tax=Streptomyces sp. MBT62 TaxID=2800410 RepID=UPI00190DFE1C|nr:hypothetical protein [Streptomyces sp. MBT62]MBK3567060.1 hypothetical protein [Streptomyces sp. MBT62]